MSTKKDFPSVFESFPSKLTIGNGIELDDILDKIT